MFVISITSLSRRQWRTGIYRQLTVMATYPGKPTMLISNQNKIILLLLQQCYLFSILSHVAMIRHSMDVIKQAVQELNPSQVPVITLDQPLSASLRGYNGTGQKSMEKISL